ncbi:MAG: alpha-hydroxy-acid oxidizing protein, partial [Hyphomicrobium denitrificans]|nr:alpha-hydroxy-acid oxidizing protein [Hyphomicrobium denitrificans]
FATKPQWVAGVLRDKRRTFGNLAGHIKGMENVTQLGQWTASQFDTTLNWKDLDWIRSIWPGKLIIKGILDIEDAREAVKTGAQALVVSNHGGRQLDGAQSSIEVLPEIVAAVGDQIEIMFDGGIRSGQDVVRALALGAKSCMIGRAYAYGLGAYGEAGVAKAIDIIRNEMKKMAENGPSEADLDAAKSYLTGSYALRFDTNSKIASQLLGLMQEGFGPDYVENRNKMIDAVTLADAKRVAARLLKSNDLIVTVVGKPDGMKSEIPAAQSRVAAPTRG